MFSGFPSLFHWLWQIRSTRPRITNSIRVSSPWHRHGNFGKLGGPRERLWPGKNPPGVSGPSIQEQDYGRLNIHLQDYTVTIAIWKWNTDHQSDPRHVRFWFLAFRICEYAIRNAFEGVWILIVNNDKSSIDKLPAYRCSQQDNTFHQDVQSVTQTWLGGLMGRPILS